MTESSAAKEREFTVVMRGASAAIFLQDERLIVEAFPSAIGPVRIVFQSRWIKRSNTVTAPGDLWVEVNGKGPSLENVLVPFANAGLALLPLLALSANAAVIDAELELGFESTANVRERDYFQNYVPPESSDLHCMRRIDVETTVALLQAIHRHRDAERLRRAANQYCLALDSWKLGRESLSLAHLWMALEALTKVKIRSECTRKSIGTPQELADNLGIELKELDTTVRRDFILNNDVECYRNAKAASDGLEHGFLGYDKIAELSKGVRHRMAKYIRNAILELAEVDEKSMNILTGGRFEKPLGYWPLVKYFRGHLIGENSVLAAKGNAYPVLIWKPIINTCEITADGQVKLECSENLTASIGEGIVFKPTSFEAWRAE